MLRSTCSGIVLKFSGLQTYHSEVQRGALAARSGPSGEEHRRGASVGKKAFRALSTRIRVQLTELEAEVQHNSRASRAQHPCASTQQIKALEFCVEVPPLVDDAAGLQLCQIAPVRPECFLPY
jgi:hypothetical protein